MGSAGRPGKVEKVASWAPRIAAVLEKVEKASKGPKWTLKWSYLGVEVKPEAQKLPGNSTQEYYHPTKYEPQPARLAQVMRSMSGLRSGSGSGP